MTDFEKVVKGLSACIDSYKTCQKGNWPYKSLPDEYSCSDELMKDALALIRELEAKSKAYDQVKWERDIAVGQLEQIGKSLGEKMDDVKNILARNAEIPESTEANRDESV